ncbi:hypothetical protein SDC9_145786 [bioreactor metagenome]|uniref:Uncharacterized protein n=1 Tax=bioreactor metagenome TaxID=1076179 RepID=A0A645EBV8_9ZZZZ
MCESGQIHEHVDAVLADSFAQRFVVQIHHIQPIRHQRAHVFGRAVRGAIRVDMHLDVVGIVMSQHRLHEKGHRMLAEVRRHIADFELFARVAVCHL